MEANELTNVINTPTRGKNILDLLFIREDGNIRSVESLVNISLSDHNLLIVKYSQHRDLGIQMQNNGGLKSQINNVVSKIRKKIDLIC